MLKIAAGLITFLICLIVVCAIALVAMHMVYAVKEVWWKKIKGEGKKK